MQLRFVLFVCLVGFSFVLAEETEPAAATPVSAILDLLCAQCKLWETTSHDIAASVGNATDTTLFTLQLLCAQVPTEQAVAACQTLYGTIRGLSTRVFGGFESLELCNLVLCRGGSGGKLDYDAILAMANESFQPSCEDCIYSANIMATRVKQNSVPISSKDTLVSACMQGFVLGKDKCEMLATTAMEEFYLDSKDLCTATGMCTMAT